MKICGIKICGIKRTKSVSKAKPRLQRYSSIGSGTDGPQTLVARS